MSTKQHLKINSRTGNQRIHIESTSAANLKRLMQKRNGLAPLRTNNKSCHEGLLLCHCPACCDNYCDWHASGCLLDENNLWTIKD